MRWKLSIIYKFGFVNVKKAYDNVDLDIVNQFKESLDPPKEILEE